MAQDAIGDPDLQPFKTMSIRAAHDMPAASSEEHDLRRSANESADRIKRTIESLSTEFRGYSVNERERVKEIFLWVAKNIDYDMEAVGASNYDLGSSYVSVFERGKGLCLGFARLFATICEHTGIESRIVTGYAKGQTYESEETFGRPNHAWNSVRIDDKWHLIDVAWASSMRMSIENQFGYLPNNQFTDQYLLDFFLVEPKKFLETHLPEDPFWQLTGQPIRLSTFEAGEEAIAGALATAASTVNFEHIIQGHDALDSLDRVICLYDRLVENPRNNDREYGLGVSYFYKAVAASQQMQELSVSERQMVAKRSVVYYRKALEYLESVLPGSLYHDNVLLLCENIRARMATLGGNMYF